MAGLSAGELNQQDLHKIARQTEEAVTQAEEDTQENKGESLAGTAREITNTPNSLARQQIFRSLAAQHGNNYAARLGTAVMRQGANTPAHAAQPEPPDELDTLLGLTAHAKHYTDSQLEQARQLATAETDQAKRSRLFNLLQHKANYYIQWKNNTKGFSARTHTSYNLGVYDMCNVTSLAMALEGVGITLTKAKQTFPNTLQEYKASLLEDPALSTRNNPLSQEDRQQWANEATEATRFPDFLEQLRQVHHLGARTGSDAWNGLANLFGVNLTFLTGTRPTSHPKQWWLDNVKTALEGGSSVVLGVDSHIIRLKEVNDDGLVVDDPNVHTDLGTAGNTRSGLHLDFTWDYSRSGENNLVPWDVAERYQFRWVYKLTGGDATTTARPRSAATAPATTPAPVAAATNPPLAQNSPHQPAPANAQPGHTEARPAATPAQGVLSPEDQQTALAAMIMAMHTGIPKNRVIDQGYYAIRGEGRIDPANRQAVNEWLFIRNSLFQSALTAVPIYLDGR